MRSRVHGEASREAETPEYVAWITMRARCLNPRHRDYARFGGCGIRVCASWRDSFENFLADMGRKPSPSHALGRRDERRGFTPSNCFWKPRELVDGRKRNTRLVTYRGETKSLAAWARATGLPYQRLVDRLNRGWSVERVFEVGVPGRRVS